MEGLIQYINFCYQSFVDNQFPHDVYVVMGNYSGDLDSTIGAVLLSYFLTLKYHAANNYTEEVKEAARVYVPCLGYEKDHLRFKLDVIEHLKQTNFPTDSEDQFKLISIFDMDLSRLLEDDRLHLILYDHNQLQMQDFPCDSSEDFERFERRVVGIYDHHVDQHAYDDQLEFNKIEPTGSATRYFDRWIYSLIVKDILEWEKHNEKIIQPDLVKFILAPIILDCKFSIKKKKMKQNPVIYDSKILLKLLKIGEDEDIKQKYFKNLKSIRKDPELLCALGLQGLLVRDYKSFEFVDEDNDKFTYGMSTQKISLGSILDHLFNIGRDSCETDLMQLPDELIEESLAIMERKNLSLFILKTPEDSFTTFSCFSTSSELLSKIYHWFMEQAPTSEFPHYKEIHHTLFTFPGGCSRKQLQPILQNILKDTLLKDLNL
ncbi:unnamed protein product [Moneuplotes crassus]|uniref:Exopolyphosphatase n=1 Tax=Euplotes crassus TaxID=5936 RepID=A0AAD1UFY8_EUPCR|nr:unnamed protein product [Moneuplotes crassus]